VPTPLTGWHCKLRGNTEGLAGREAAFELLRTLELRSVQHKIVHVDDHPTSWSQPVPLRCSDAIDPFLTVAMYNIASRSCYSCRDMMENVFLPMAKHGVAPDEDSYRCVLQSQNAFGDTAGAFATVQMAHNANIDLPVVPTCTESGEGSLKAMLRTPLARHIKPEKREWWGEERLMAQRKLASLWLKPLAAHTPNRQVRCWSIFGWDGCWRSSNHELCHYTDDVAQPRVGRFWTGFMLNDSIGIQTRC
jgi:hypothetical protein